MIIDRSRSSKRTRSNRYPVIAKRVSATKNIVNAIVKGSNVVSTATVKAARITTLTIRRNSVISPSTIVHLVLIVANIRFLAKRLK